MPKNWNAAYENDDTPWDKGEAAPPLVEFLEAHSIAGRVLVPGCGLGHDVRLLASQGAAALGMDIALTAVRKAQAFPAVADESYVAGDFLDLSIESEGQFEWVFEHTCLCALELDQREDYAAAVAKALQPGGNYLAVFYREVTDYGGDGPPHPISAEAIDALFDARFERVKSFVPKKSYPSRSYGCEEVVWFRKR